LPNDFNTIMRISLVDFLLLLGLGVDWGNMGFCGTYLD
jgi:hypothetical protein